MSDHLVLIRTYRDFLQADEAQAELQAAGIYSLLVAKDDPSPVAPFAYPVALAVDGRDADMAARVLAHPVRATP
jgi:hypothetical protein